MSQQSLMNHYESLEVMSERMLQAARRGDWEHVQTLEQTCLGLISQLTQMGQEQGLTGAQLQQKRALMLRIVQNDASIRDCMNDQDEARASERTNRRLH